MGYHLSMQGIRKGTLFMSVGPRGGASSIKLCRVHPSPRCRGEWKLLLPFESLYGG